MRGFEMSGQNIGDKISMVNKPLRNMGLINKGDSVNVSFSLINRNVNQSYVDCADCTRIEGWKGTKTQAYCTRR